MTEAELQQLANETGIDISNSVLGLPLKRQEELAKKRKMTLDEYQKDSLESLKVTHEDNEETDTMTGREFIEREPLEKRYAAACFCARVYTRDNSPEEVLKLSGYSDKEIEEIIQADESNQIPA